MPKQISRDNPEGSHVADSSCTPPPESRDCLKPVSGYRIHADFSYTNKRFRPNAVFGLLHLHLAQKQELSKTNSGFTLSLIFAFTFTGYFPTPPTFLERLSDVTGGHSLNVSKCLATVACAGPNAHIFSPIHLMYMPDSSSARS